MFHHESIASQKFLKSSEIAGIEGSDILWSSLARKKKIEKGEVAVEFLETKKFIEEYLEQKCLKESMSVEEVIFFFFLQA